MRQKKGNKNRLVKYWVALAIAVLVGVQTLVMQRRAEVHYVLPHRFGVGDPSFFASALALGNPLTIEGNRIDLLHNGDAIFPAMLKAIEQAQKTISFEAYIFWSDEIGNKFCDALCERAQSGVHVRVLLDGLGSGTKLDNSDVDRMRKAGCELEYYHPMRSWRLDKINRRTHRRLLVVDGKLGFTGSVGFAHFWQGNADAKEHWRDSQIRLEGPIVTQLQAAFQQHWIRVRPEALGGQENFPALAKAGEIRAQLIPSTSPGTPASTPLVYASAISSAEKNIWIANSYFVPGDDLVKLLVEAVKRGVDVRLMVPGEINDVPATKASGRRVFGKLLEGGVHIFEYQPTMFHLKTMVVDGLFSMAGSSNFDSRSFQVNEELDLGVYDREFAGRMEKMFAEDLKQTREYTLEQFKNRSIFERISEWIAVPFRSQM